MSALLIHLSGGRIETHFHVFGSLAFLAFYLDWRVIITATVVVGDTEYGKGVGRTKKEAELKAAAAAWNALESA
jgi:hypothetical protein